MTSKYLNVERHTIYLIDKLQDAQIHAPHENFVNIQRVPIYRDSRSSIFQHPPSRIEFRPILLGQNPKLRFACGIKQKVLPKLNHGILFEIELKTQFGWPLKIFQQEVSPIDLQKDGWLEYELDLSRYKGKRVGLLFSTSVPEGYGTEYCWSVWGNPQIEHETSTTVKQQAKDKPAHIFLITSDALRSDHIGAYGNTEVSTPNIDQLAKEGILFTHARAQTASTLGSYASILLSQHPHTHSINTEWGTIKKGFPSLPGYLRQSGYKTIFAPSELELMDIRTGIPLLFDECTPCNGEPAQDGSITTRLFLDLLNGCNKPTFFWLEYFDTHPPMIPPEPYHSMYYKGDPESQANQYRANTVKKIKGVETMQELDVALPLLKSRFIDAIFVERLKSVTRAFLNDETSSPDFAIHLKNLGPKACNNMPQEQFAHWLEKQVAQLKHNTVPQPLLDWLEEIYPFIQEINDDITAWLDGVVDFRYPVSQYKAGVSYFDSHLGKLFAHLNENGLYEQSLIIVTSPHGEILDEHDIYFHHHTLTESCLHIPMVIKPPQNGASFTPGTRIDGIFDSIDLFPTITDLLGLKTQQGLAGISRTTHIYSGAPIPEHDSFAINNAFTLSSITNGRYKYMRAEKDHAISEQWKWHQGDQALFDLHDVPNDTKNLMDELPQLAKEMEQRLGLFLQNKEKLTSQ